MTPADCTAKGMDVIMRGTFLGIEIGRTGINMGQFGLDVTGHNIANVNTRGFTRQRIVQTANDPFGSVQMVKPISTSNVGGGVRVQIHDQIRSAFLDRRFRTENTAASYWETRTQELRSVESFFDNVDERTSINNSLLRFFTAMDVMARDPVAGAPRKELQTSALDMVQQFQSIHSGLVELQRSQDRAIVANVNTINELAERLVTLNKAIYSFELTGQIANDLRDQRNVLLDELSTLVDIDYEENRDQWGGTVLTVSIGGHVLVDHDSRNLLGTSQTGTTNGLENTNMPYWVASINSSGVMTSHDPIALNLASGRGELSARIDVRDSTNVLRPGIPFHIEQLNNLARALVQHVNAVHREGFNDHPFQDSRNGINFFHEDNAFVTFTDTSGVTLSWSAENNRWENETGTLFFDSQEAAETAGFERHFDISQVTIANIRVSDEVMDSEYNIAASSVQITRDGPPENQQRGNNENMLALYALFSRNNLFLEMGDAAGTRVAIGSFDDFATGVRTSVASSTSSARNNANTARSLTLAADNHRLSVAGVQLDEEMTHLIRFNHAYNGAARVVTAMDDALDRLINGTGRVGL